MGKYVLLESFHIDGGELDGLSPQECFVLGYELASISHRAETNHGEFTAPINSKNEARVHEALVKRGRRGTTKWMPGDKSEGWLELRVYAS